MLKKLSLVLFLVLVISLGLVAEQSANTDAASSIQLINFPQTDTPVASDQQGQERGFWDKWEIRNVKTSSARSTRVIRSDVIEGPGDYSRTYSESASASISASGGLSLGEVEAALGFSSSTSVTNSFSASGTLKANEKVLISIYARYTLYEYDVYKNGEFDSSHTALEPIGIYMGRDVVRK